VLLYWFKGVVHAFYVIFKNKEVKRGAFYVSQPAPNQTMTTPYSTNAAAAPVPTTAPPASTTAPPSSSTTGQTMPQEPPSAYSNPTVEFKPAG